ncbi:hypothetical protein BH09PSE5_BH09PSE5_32200 [soil metagenome]
MIRWLLVIFIALLLFSSFGPWLEKFGLGRMPFDFRFRFLGRQWFLPIGSCVMLSLIALLVGKFL